MFNLQALFTLAGLGTLSDAILQNAIIAMDCIEKFSEPFSENELYNNYLDQRGMKLGYLSSLNITQRAILRICCLLRYNTPAEAVQVRNAWNRLKPNVQRNLEYELSQTGIRLFEFANYERT